MATYSFKSSGKTAGQRKIEQVKITPTPVGIKTPLSLGDKEIFTVTYDLKDQVGDNLRNLLLTNWGERLGLYDYGANLFPLMSEFTTLDNFDSEAITRIKSAVSRWMPFVDLESFVSKTNHSENINTAVIDMTITYNVPALNLVNRRLQLKLYVM